MKLYVGNLSYSTTEDDLRQLFGGYGAPDSVAVIDARSGLSVTYDELRGRIDTRRSEIGLETRSLVVIAASNTLSFVVDYLAVLADGHVPLLAGDHADRLADAWNAAAVIRTGCTHVGLPSWVQEVVTGTIIVQAVALDVWRLATKVRAPPAAQS